MAYDCLDLVAVRIPCETQTTIEFFLDDLGLSLVDAAKIADERYTTGKAFVASKISLAKDDVISHLTRNVTGDCDLDTTTGVICDNASKIAKAIWYRTAGHIYKDLYLDSSRYNDFIHYSEKKAVISALLYDSSLEIIAKAEGIETDVPKGLYQQELDKLEPVRRIIEDQCCTDCVGTRYQFVIP